MVAGGDPGLLATKSREETLFGADSGRIISELTPTTKLLVLSAVVAEVHGWQVCGTGCMLLEANACPVDHRLPTNGGGCESCDHSPSQHTRADAYMTTEKVADLIMDNYQSTIDYKDREAVPSLCIPQSDRMPSQTEPRCTFRWPSPGHELFREGIMHHTNPRDACMGYRTSQ